MKPASLPRLSFVLVAVVALVYGVLQLQLPHHAFWSNDGGEKLVQVRSLLDNGVGNPAIPYDRLGLEPQGSFEFAPFYPGHARIVGKKLLPVVPLYFPLLSSFFFRLWGHGGLYVVPLLATLLTLALLAWLARERFDAKVMPLVVIAGGLASPLFFYSLVFFEHTLAASLATAGLVLVELGRDRAGGRRRAFAAVAGVVTGLGIWVRGDVYFILAGLLAAMLVVRSYRSLVVPFFCGGLLALLPFYLVNTLVYGSALGPQVGSMLGSSGITSGTGSTGDGFSLLRFVAKRRDMLEYYLLAYTDNATLNALFLLTALIPGLLLVTGGDKLPQRHLFTIVWAALLVLAAGITFGRLFFLADPMSSTLGILGLFGSLPFLPFALAGIRSSPTERESGPGYFLPVFIGAALVAYGLGLPSRGGLQWGPRYLLALYPPLILLAVHGGVRLWQGMAGSMLQKVFAVLLGLLLLAGVAIQGFGIRLLHDKKKATVANMAAIREMQPAVLVTDTWWVPEDNADLYRDIPMYSFYTVEKMDALFQKLAAADTREIVLVSAADYRDFIAGKPQLSLTAFSRTEHGRLHLFNLYIHRIRVSG